MKCSEDVIEFNYSKPVITIEYRCAKLAREVEIDQKKLLAFLERHRIHRRMQNMFGKLEANGR